MCTWKTSTSAAQRTSSCNEFSRRLLTHTHTALDLTRACTFYSNCDHSLRYTARCWWKITLFLTPYVLYFFIIFVVPVVKVVLTINLPSARSRNVKEILPSHLGVLIRFSTLSCLADIGLMELTLQMVAVFRQVFSTMSRQQVSRVTSCWGWVLFDVISLQLMYSMTRTSSFITQQLDENNTYRNIAIYH